MWHQSHGGYFLTSTYKVMEHDQLVTVATFDFDWQAHIAQGLLTEEGIQSVIDNEIFGSLYPIGFNSIGGINLKVMNRDAERARQIITNSKI